MQNLNKKAKSSYHCTLLITLNKLSVVVGFGFFTGLEVLCRNIVAILEM